MAMRWPAAKPFYVLSQYTGADGELAWCVVDSAAVRGDAEFSEQQRQAYVDQLAAREERDARQDGRDPVRRHGLFVTVSLDELCEMGLGYLVGKG